MHNRVNLMALILSLILHNVIHMGFSIHSSEFPYFDSVQITHFTTTIFITSKNEHLKRITLRCQCILLRRKVASVNLSIRQCMHILYLLGANVNTCNSNTLAQEMGNLVRQITRFVKIKMTISLLTFNCWS